MLHRGVSFPCYFFFGWVTDRSIHHTLHRHRQSTASEDTCHLTFAVQDGNVIGGQARLGFDADQQRAATTSGYTFAREMNALETQREGTFLQVVELEVFRIIKKINQPD